jgi:hypothetical protein
LEVVDLAEQEELELELEVLGVSVDLVEQVLDRLDVEVREFQEEE